MKKITTALAILLLTTSMIQAQASGTTSTPASGHPKKEMTMEEKVDNKLKKQAAELNLDAGQQERMKMVLTNYMNQKKALKEKKDAPTTRDQRKALAAESKAMQENFHRDIAAILNPEQYQKWQQMEARQKEKRAKK